MDLLINSNRNEQNARRKVLFAVVCAICHEQGFTNADRAAIETLIEILQSTLKEIGRSSQSFVELSGRVQPIIGDIAVALIEMGLNIDSLSTYAKRPNRIVVSKPAIAPKQSVPKILQAGQKKNLFSYIPDYYPAFPDPHAYIRTPTHKQPVTEYEAIREKAASQKRDVERALTRFMAKTSENSLTHSLFPDEQMCHLFPLIPMKLDANSYIHALLPKDQIFDEDEEEEREVKESPKKAVKIIETVQETSEKEPGAANNVSVGEEGGDAAKIVTPENTTQDQDVPDNPYLRPTKLFKVA